MEKKKQELSEDSGVHLAHEKVTGEDCPEPEASKAATGFAPHLCQHRGATLNLISQAYRQPRP